MSACALCKQRDALHVRGAVPRERAPIRVDRWALRRALGGRVELVEAQATAKATGRPRANVGAIWRYFTTSTYESGDLPVIATREALQNALDAIKAAIRRRQIRAGEGSFAVTWDPATRSLTWADNGVGMDADTILNKFLSLGDSGKSDAASSDEAAGGFGVAKAVILGVSKTFRWEMHTRDNLAVARGMDADVEVFDAPPRQGTRITVHDVAEDHETLWDHGRQAWIPLLERIRELLGANDLPEVTILLNGEPVAPLFSRRGGGRVTVEADWGPGTSARVRAYRRPPGDRQGAWYVRLNGLHQFKRPSDRGGLKADMVIDLTTTVRPGHRDYPLTAARDQLQGAARNAFRELITVVERENESSARSEEDEIFDPVGTSAAPELAQHLGSLLDDPELRALLASARGGVADFYAAQATLSPEPVESSAPPGSPAQASEGFVHPPGQGALVVDRVSLADMRQFLIAADRAIAESQGSSDYDGSARQERGVFSPTVEWALNRIDQGKVEPELLGTVEYALERAAELGMAPPEGRPLVRAAVPQPPAPKAADNPFGALAGLRISKANYDKGKARKFKKNVQRWVPFLVAWDGTLRLLARELGVRRAFKPGFVLDDTLVGLTAKTENGPLVISIHPDRFADVVDAHRHRPIAIAAFLQAVAIHEFTHADGRLSRGHDEEFVVAREDLGHATGHLLPAIERLVRLALKLPAAPDSDAARAERLAAELQGVRARVEVLKKELAALKRETRKPPRPPREGDVQTPGTRLAWNTLSGWLDAWDVLARRPHTSKRHTDLAAHLEALPDRMVEEATSAQLDRLEALLALVKPPRGQRAGHPTTRLTDALDRARVRARGPVRPPPRAAPARPSVSAALLEATRTTLRRSPPAGLTAADVDGFFTRQQSTLLRVVEEALR